MSDRMKDKLSKNFTRIEFACKGTDCCGHSAPMDSKLIKLLQEVRTALALPLVVTSGFRCVAYNSTVKGAVSGSFHTTGQAADVTSPKASAATVYFTALACIRTLGYGFALLYEDRNFVHIDVGER